ncbi:Serologically defined colon cancer antigen 3-like protein, partial [Larimichthys crocea]
EEVEAEELNPFSFREFLRWKNQEPEPDQDQDEEQTHIKEEDWGRSFQSGVDSTSSLCTEDEDEEETRVVELSEELHQRRRQEEKEAQDLESMVHSVEQNLHLMTKRAVKAESSVSKLKAELQQLQ